MRKTKFSKLLILILTVTMAFSILALTACSNGNGHTNISSDTDIEKDESPVKNGSFTYANGTDYPRVPLAWSGSIGGTGRWEPEGGLDALKTGIINVGTDWDYNHSIWGAPTNPGKHEGAKDDNVLMIYASKPSSYSYASDSFTISADSYYKLSFWVNTSADLSGELDADGNRKEGTDFGAYLCVNGGNVNANWIDIKTEGKWQKFEMYIEGGNTNNTLKVTLGLGRGDKGQKHLTKGHIYFDDVILEDSTKEAYDAAKVNHTPSNQDNDTVFVHKDSFKFTNTAFTNYDRFYTSVPSYPFAWNDGVGGVDDDRASLIPTEDRPSVIKGIVGLDPDTIAQRKDSYGFTQEILDKKNLRREGATDDNALMIYTDKNYSVNYIASSQLTVKKGSIVRLGVWARTFDSAKVKDQDGNEQKIKAKGTIMLYNDNEEYRISFDNEKMYFVDPADSTKTVKEIALNNPDDWNEFVFYLRGNNTHDVTYKVMLALGTDGKSKQENWSCGHVLFDDISIKEMQVSDDNKVTTLAQGWAKAIDEAYVLEKNFALDLNKKDSSNIIESNIPNAFFNGSKTPVGSLNIPEGYELVKKETDVTFNGTLDVVDGVDLPFDVIYKFGDINESQLAKNVLKFASQEGSTVGIKSTYNLVAKMNKQYRLAFWVKTVDIEKNSGLFIKMNILDKEDKVKDTKTIKANSKFIAKDAANFDSQWQEVVFYISGDSNDDIRFNIELQYGDGTLFEGKLAKGEAYVFNPNFQQIDGSAYSNASTNDIIQKVDLTVDTTSNDKIANANFNKYKTASSSFNKEDGMLDKFADPQSWSVSNDDIPKEILNVKDTEGKVTDEQKKVSRGIINLIDEYTSGKLIFERMLDNAGADADYISAVKTAVQTKLLTDDQTNRFALAIYSNEDIINTVKSNYINLSANSYYSISIRVFTMPGTIASVKLTSNSPHKENIDVIKEIKETAGWTEYTFFVKTGLSSASVSLALSLGSLDMYKENNTTGLSKGLVLFDYATQVTYTKETYEAAQSKFDKDGNLIVVKDENGQIIDDGIGELGIENSNQQRILEFDTDGFVTDSYEKEKLNEINGWSKNTSASNKEIAGNYSPTISGVIDWTMFDKNIIWGYDKNGEHDKDKIKDFVDAKANKVLDAKKAANKFNGVTVEEELLNVPEFFGNSVLMIDNIDAAGVSIYNSSSKTLAKNEYYKISILIYTDLVKNDDEEKLNISLKIGSRDEDLIEIKGIDTNKEWKEISFFIKNNEKNAPDLSATLTMTLGSTTTVDNKDTLKAVEGMVFADNFNIEKVTEADYNAAVEAKDALQATKEYKPDKPIDPDKEDEDAPAPQKPGVDWQMLSWAIPTIILAVMILVVLGVFMYKKYAGPKQHKRFKGDKKKPKKQEIKKQDKYDSFED